MISKQGVRWLVDIQPGGRVGKRVRKLFDRKADALQYERSILSRYALGFDLSPVKDRRLLSDLVNIWFENFGVSLSSGKDSLLRLNKAVLAMNDPAVFSLKASHFLDYRSARLESGIDPKTLNKELALFNALFHSLKDSGLVFIDNPFLKVRPIRVHQSPMTFLDNDQIISLMDSLRGTDAFIIAWVCLSTGARWGEAQNLTWSSLVNGQVHFHNTKSKKSRFIPVSSLLFRSLQDRLKHSGFLDSYSTFSRRLDSLGLSDSLPKGQRSHVLRHTFASYFMMSGGNILTLQKILGHSSLDMTLRYAHLAPDYLNEVIEKNPVSSFG